MGWEKSTLGERVLKICALRGWTLNELGRRAGYESGPMSRLSRHKAHVGGSPEVLAALARAGRVHLDWLVDGTGEIELPIGEQASDRYPERARALRRLSGLIPPEVDEQVRSIRFQEGAAPPLRELDWIELALRRLKDHALTEQLDAVAERDTAEAERLTKPRK